jgi:hypothetical protein
MKALPSQDSLNSITWKYKETKKLDNTCAFKATAKLSTSELSWYDFLGSEERGTKKW